MNADFTDSDKTAALDRLLNCGAIAIVRAGGARGLVEAAEAIVAGGVVAVEFTLTTPEAPRLIRETRERLEDRALVGAGTVLNAGEAETVLEAGAQFIVSPGLKREVIECARSAGVPAVPGALTPTEVLTAWDWGADLVKVFPASVGGPEYIRALAGPLPHVRLVPTGGVSATNAGDYIRAGAAAVAVGGNLVDRAAIAVGEFNRLTDAARELMRAIHQARSA